MLNNTCIKKSFIYILIYNDKFIKNILTIKEK